MPAERQPLHWVIKISDRQATVVFIRNVLGMTVLRHEEFETGCEAHCNGPYDGRWSKTIIGYGPENTHFTLELTYTYGIGSYDFRHDLRGITIQSQQVAERVKKSGYAQESTAEGVKLISPDGYPFFIKSDENNRPSAAVDPIKQISLSVSNLSESIEFWTNIVKMQLLKNNSDGQHAFLAYNAEEENFTPEFQIELVQQQPAKSSVAVEHGTAFGRIVFACPQNQLLTIQNAVNKQAGGAKKAKVLTPLVSLDTPGKTTVQVVILADPDGYEIGFVGSEAFWQLCQADPDADRLLDEAIARDDSSEWYKKKRIPKPAAAMEA